MVKQKSIHATAKSIKNTTSASFPVNRSKIQFSGLKNQLGIIIAIFAFALYAQSISFNYALDDSLITSGNYLVKEGFAGIPQLLKSDQAFGLKDEGERVLTYRPISLVAHAVQWQFFPNSPHVYHLINVLLYSLTCWLLFLLLCKLFESRNEDKFKTGYWNLIIPFISVLFFAAHPLHTEVVDNIKSQDELLCFLFLILSVFSFIKAEEKKSLVQFILGVILFNFGLFSKESAISYILIIPLILYVFTNAGIKKILYIILSLAVVSAIFLFIHFKVLESVTQTRIDILHSAYFNSLAAAPDFITQKATAFYILLRYVFLLLFPYHLSYDYSVSEIPLYSLSNPMVLLSILLYLAIGIYGILKIIKKDVAAFAILFYLLTLVPVSNIIIRINCTMAERFMFTPSLGFCMLLALILIKITKTNFDKTLIINFQQLVKKHALLFTIVFIITGAYSVRTLARNPDWKDDISLNTHDVKVANNSARVHFCYGSILLNDLYPKEKNNDKKANLLNEAILELNIAASIYPDLPPIAYARLGTAYGYLGDYKNVIYNYKIAIRKSPFTPAAYFYCDLGLAYSLTTQYEKALSILDSSVKYYPEYKDAYVGKSLVYLQQGKFIETVAESDKLLQLDPNNVLGHLYKGCGLLNLKQYKEAIKYLTKGSELDPNNADFYQYLAMAFQQTGDTINARQYADKYKSFRNQ